MNRISFKRHRFPSAVICQAVRWYFRFTLSIRDVEELMAERGIEVSREAIRCWVIKFGPLIAANLRQRRMGGRDPSGLKSGKGRAVLRSGRVKLSVPPGVELLMPELRQIPGR